MAGYGQRDEDLDKAHGVTEAHWEAFIDLVRPKEGQVILDLMGGSGAVAKQLYKVNPNLNLLVMDAYEHQLRKAPSHFKRIIGDVRQMPLEDNSVDTVIIKMGLHELQLKDQEKSAKEIYRILKPEGSFINWMVYLEEQERKAFHDMVIEKDKICGLDDMAKNRYFPSYFETLAYLYGAGFNKTTCSQIFGALACSRDRLKGDFKGDEAKLNEWHAYMRDNWDNISSNFLSTDSGDNIIVNYPVRFIVAVK